MVLSYKNQNNFKAQFCSTIDSNEMLSIDQKHFYLQSSLVDAAKQIQSTDITYESLLDTFKIRFDNKRLIVKSYKILFDVRKYLC